MSALYDTIGKGYAARRQTDPRIAAAIHAQLGEARTVLNIGAGTGSYEPGDLEVTAVEPSAKMIAQRLEDAAPVVQASAESLPFADKSFDASMAILTVHHWSDVEKGLAEMRRVARDRIVILTFDPALDDFWLFDYLPELAALDRRQMPDMADFETALGPVQRVPVPIPHDCIDGLLCAYWRRPAAYLDENVRRGMSSFSKIADVGAGLQRLDQDIRSGAWARKYARFLDRESCDFGYHLVVTV
ncbi:class I SAM-dependent methyltransferase [Marimonas arenosa]|uniref:Class I SAM-dependent methyltransferase n=1 Tax=Marimonas arenosa TaxID=1795305 RepID=A0AAE4B476_9RHOB|nr:class I SAM-dependent methyltransferase [Marimonas arenosa]MDQ2089945.1 class I SAM-dependent methyltransferase [Marimonas arenosa]